MVHKSIKTLSAAVMAVVLLGIAGGVDSAVRTHSELIGYLDSIESGKAKYSPLDAAEVIVQAVRDRIHFGGFGYMLPNDVEFTNVLQRTMIMYMSSNRAVKKWIELEKQGAGEAIRYIDDPDEELAMTALYVLGKSGSVSDSDKKKTESVMLDDERWKVRNRAVLCMYHLGQMDGVKKALNDPHWNVRLLAVRAVGRTGDFDGLIEAIQKETARQERSPDELYIWDDGPRYWVLRGAAHELKMNRFERKLDEMVRKNSDSLKRLEAVRAFTWMEESGTAHNALRTALDDEVANVRMAAIRGIGHQRWVNRELRDIVKMLKDEDIGVRQTTVNALLSHWNPLMMRHLAPVLDDPDSDAAYAAAAAMVGIRNELVPPISLYGQDESDEKKKDVIRQAKEIWEKYGDKIDVKEPDLAELDFLAPPDLCDLDILCVQLTPEYSWGTDKVRPDIGEEVTWIGYLENKGTKPTGDFIWTVNVDGKEVLSEKGESLEPNEIAELKWVTPYLFSNRWITFSVRPQDGRKEITGYNNSLSFRENSITAGYWVEDGRRLLYDKIQAYFHRGANSYEDWQQRNLAFWNASTRRSVYLLMPEGGLEHIRAQKIVRLTDGALPLSGGLTGNNPDMKDHTVDVMWGFPGKDVEKRNPFGAANWGYFTWLECSLHHEMSHARYLADFYGLNTRGEDTEVRLPSGKRMFSPSRDSLYNTDQGIIMKSGYFAGYSEAHSAAMGRIVSRRAINGAWNASPNLGEYLSDLPSSVTFRILDSTGRPLANAMVDIYQSVNDQREWDHRTGFYDHQIDETADISGTADSEGSFRVERQILSGDRISGYLGNSFVLVVVRSGDQIDWQFYEVTQLNMAAWENGFGHVVFTFQTNISTTGVPIPQFTSGVREGGNFRLTWTPVAKRYDLYTKRGSYDWEVSEQNLATNTCTVPRREREQYCVVAIDGEGNRSARSKPFVIKPPRRPKHVAVDCYGDRYFIDNSIYFLSPEGSYLGDLRYGNQAADIDVGPDGTIVTLAPKDKRKVQIENEEGKPEKVDLELNDRVVVINSNSYLRWFSGDDEMSKLVDPRGVAIAPDGRVYVVSTGSRDIVVFDGEGNALRRFGGEGESEGMFLEPVDIDINMSGIVAVADEGHGSIQIFDLDGNFKSRIDGLNKPRAIELDLSGNVYAATGDGILVLDPRGKQVMEIREYEGEGLTNVLDLAVTMANEIIIARKDKEDLITLPPVNGFAIDMICPDFLIEDMPVSVDCVVRNVSGRPRMPEAVSVIDSNGRAAAVLSRASGAGSQPDAGLYSGEIEGAANVLNDGFVIIELEGLRYAFPRVEKKKVDVSIQVRRLKRTSPDDPERFDFSLVMDNNTRKSLSAAMSIGELPEGVSLELKDRLLQFLIPPGGRETLDLRTKIDVSKGLFAASIPMNFEIGEREFLETAMLETPIMWKIFGPIPAKADEGFATSYPPEERIDFDQTFEKDGVVAKWFDLPYTWPNYEGVLFLEERLEPASFAGIYAYTVLFSDVEQEALLKFGTDDTITAWFNGEKIINKNTRRGVTVDEDIVPVRLKAGANEVLLKVWNEEGGWGFIMRLTDKDGNPLPGVRAIPHMTAK